MKLTAFYLFQGLAILQAVCGEAHRVSLKLKPTGERAFVDSAGRELFFHGVNAVVKGPPWIPETDIWDGEISLSDKDLDDLESLGLNIIRLGTMWPGVQPSAKDSFSSAYVQKVRRIVDSAARRGIHTLLDMHQDVISENFCGEGVPDWAIKMAGLDKTFPSPKNDNTSYTDVAADGFPLRSDCNKYDWPSYYSTYNTGEAFEALYDTSEDSKGLLSAWADFWTYLAQEFKDNDFVLGYELINEPWAGDVFTTPSLLIPGVADKNRLQPAYDVLAQAIRAVDETTLLFFAAVTWDDVFPSGFTAAPGGPTQADKSVFAYHYYSPPQMVDAVYFRTRVEDAQRLNTGAMLTEFERPRNDNDMTTDPYFATVGAADQHLQSWAMWELKTFCKETNQSLASDSQNAAYGSCKTGYGEENYLWDREGVLNVNTSTKLARTYATAVAGNTSRMHFDVSSARFELVYAIDTHCSLPTVVFAHQPLQYPQGFQVTVLPERVVDWKDGPEGKNTLEFWPRLLHDDENYGHLVTITITRK